ncbi:MFS transporter [Demequina sediminicola]|uniref:MFS transporter n=1 Tax=Demequina sediminicola TaxID=1095026 RepID=UPI000A702322|nr:MFS transporter [Demequina sediminicola]
MSQTSSVPSGTAAAPSKFTARQWLLLLGCGMGFAITGADPAVFSANISLIRADLGLDSSQTAFIASLATLMLAAVILGAGVLGDIRGKKQMFIVGALITVVGEVAVALSPNFAALVGARMVVGVGFAFLLGLSLTIVNASFTAEQRPRAIGMYLALAFACTAPMPAIASLIAANVGWRAGFLVFAVVALISGAIAWKFIDPIPVAKGRRFDVPGIALAAVALVGLVLGISRLQEGVNSYSLIPLGIGLAAGVGFVMVERRVEQPALDLRLFSRGPFNAGVAGGATFNFMTGGFTLLVSYYLVVVQDASTAVLGIIMIPAALIQAFAAGWAGRLITRFGSRTSLLFGLTVCTVTCVLFATLGVNSSMALVVVAFIMLSLSNAFTQTPESNLMMSFAPRELGGSIAGVKSGIGQTFYSLGPVVFSVIASMFLQAFGAEKMAAAGVDSDEVRGAFDAADGTAQSGSTGGSQILDPDQAAEVTEAIREPFAQALQATSLTVAIVPIVAILLVMRLLPKESKESKPAAGAGTSEKD